MPIDPRTVVDRWFEEVWNQGREETVDELFAADAVAHGLGEGGTDARGPAEFKIFLRNMRSALPDVHVQVMDTIVEGENVAIRLLLTGTHRGDSLGIPASGRAVTVPAITMARLSNGQLVEGWNVWDQLGFLQQIGAVPSGRDRFMTT
jgi:steroid delta-isomerase-like uncharacterized protein